MSIAPSFGGAIGAGTARGRTGGELMCPSVANSIPGAAPNVFKETNGFKRGRLAPLPISNPLDYQRHFPQRRHNPRHFAPSEPSNKLFGDVHVERRHVRPDPRPETPPGMPPALRRVGPLLMTARVDNTRKYPGREQELSLKQPRVEGKRTVEGPSSQTCTGLGPGVGNVKTVLNEEGVSMRQNRSKEQPMHELTGRVKKFDMHVVKAHASRETPVSFPGWPGYPPSHAPDGSKIDYSLAKNGGRLAQRRITSSTFPQTMAWASAGNSSFDFKTQNRDYQNELRHMKGSDINVATQGPYNTARTRPQYLHFGFRRGD